MAKLSPKKINLNEINGGNEYLISDAVQPDTINGIIGASAYAQALATNTPDVSSANKTGTPNVSIIEGTDGTPRLSFSNLKGEKGDSGVGDAKLSNTVGESDTNGYTQKATNSVISNPNLLINGDFRVNQRGKTSYSGKGEYTVDRWYNSNEATIVRVGVDRISIEATTKNGYILQRIEKGYEQLKGKTVTFSAKIDGVVYKSTGIVPTSFSTESIYNVTGSLQNSQGTLSDCALYIRPTDLRAFVQIGVKTGKTIVVEWVKLEVSPVATSFSPRPYAEEIALCQRYYKRIVPNAENSIAVGTMQPATTISGFAVFNFGIPMQKTPTISYSSLSDLAIGYNDTSTGQTTITSMGYANTDRSLTTYKSYVTGTGFTQGQFTYFVVKPNGYIEFDAEIY